MRRPLTAWQTWRAVPARLASSTGWPNAPVLFEVALVSTLVGTIVLLWCGTAVVVHVSGEHQDSREPSVMLLAARTVTEALRTAGTSRIGARTAVAGLLAVAAFVAWRLGDFASHGLAGTFASMDHPFHLARTETLRRSLAAGEGLRWVANHQGGYPAEFYPLGFAHFEIGLWLITAATASLLTIHTVAVILVFLAPLAIYWGLARHDRWPPLVAVVAGILQVAIPGGIWHGGYSELVQMGLVSNVTAATAVLAAFLAMVAGLEHGNRRTLGLAALAAGGALWINPRSAIGLAVCAVAAAGTAIDVGRWRASAGRTMWRTAVVASLAALLAAPELLSLVRFGGLYYFVRLTGYVSSTDYLRASIESVSVPVFACAVTGCVTAYLTPPEKRATRAAVVALTLYVAVTTILSFDRRLGAIIQQLETTRLMPLQRLLTIYLAAVGLHTIAQVLGLLAGRWRAHVTDGTQLAAAAMVLLVYFGPLHLMPAEAAGLYPTDRADTPETAALQLQLAIAQREATRGEAVLVVGSAMSAHQQLWSPLVFDRPYFYDNWLWGWQTEHVGPYDPRFAAWYAPKTLARVFDSGYLTEHGIGAVVVATERAQRAAAASPALRQLTAGMYAVYTVIRPTAIVTFGAGAADSIAIGNHEITAEGQHPGGAIVVRRNWHPRWHAEINGVDVPIKHLEDGYMAVEAPAGYARLTLRYGVDRWDRAGRYAALTGLTLVGYLLWPRRRTSSAASLVAAAAGAYGTRRAES